MDLLEVLVLNGFGVTPVESREVPSDLRKPLGSAADICSVPESTPSSDLARWKATGAEFVPKAGGDWDEELGT